MWVRFVFRTIRKSANPRPEFRHALWTRLSREMEAISPPVGVWSGVRLMRFATVPVAVLLLAVGTGAYAYVNPEITYEHPLYRVKHAVEQMEGAFAFSPRARARFESRIMARRVEELETLTSLGKADGRVSEEIARAHERAIAAAAEVKGEAARDAVVARIEEQADRHVRALEAVEAQVPEGAEEVIERVIERAEEALERRLEHVYALREERVARQLERIERLEELRDQAFDAKEAREEAEEDAVEVEDEDDAVDAPSPQPSPTEGRGDAATDAARSQLPDSPSRPLPDSLREADE